MINYTIRKATPKDARSIADVHVATWKIVYPGIVGQAHLDALSVETSQKNWDQNLARLGEDYMVLVAEGDEKLLGFANIGRSQDDLNREGRKDGAELYAIYLHPDYHGKGLGSALFKACQAEARRMNCKTYSCWVIKDHDAGHEFYKRMGGKLASSSEKTLVINGYPYAIVSYEWIL